MKILGYDYTLNINEDFAESESYYGSCTYKNQRIQIRSDLCQDQITSTILHEILEALNYHLQLKLEHPIIMSLESGLYQVLKDNGVDLSPLTRELK